MNIHSFMVKTARMMKADESYTTCINSSTYKCWMNAGGKQMKTFDFIEASKMFDSEKNLFSMGAE